MKSGTLKIDRSLRRLAFKKEPLRNRVGVQKSGAQEETRTPTLSSISGF